MEETRGSAAAPVDQTCRILPVDSELLSYYRYLGKCRFHSLWGLVNVFFKMLQRVMRIAENILPSNGI